MDNHHDFLEGEYSFTDYDDDDRSSFEGTKDDEEEDIPDELDQFLKTLDLEQTIVDKTADILQWERVTLNQILSGLVSIQDLEEVGVPKEALGKIDQRVKVMITADTSLPQSVASNSNEYYFRTHRAQFGMLAVFELVVK